MTTVTIRGIPVSFPFKPYDIQKDYMEKVIECMQDEKHGVLESPTGTGKTLSLLCSSLAWLTVQKAKYQAEVRNCGNFFMNEEEPSGTTKIMWDVPTIIYASRTHSQLIQAMQELKRTSYAHVKSTILGSRDQLCIHPEVSQQTNNAIKINMCQLMVKSRSCHYHTRVEKMTTDKSVNDMNIADIEDLVKMGQKLKFCPYYMTKELKKSADIVFLPYNYLLDPKARRAQQLDLKNSVVILDEAHNVERMCEDSASFQISTTDITLCIDEVTQVMKHLETVGDLGITEAEKDFSAEDLVLLKSMLLDLEKVIDEIPLSKSEEGSTFEGKFIFDILSQAGINDTSQTHVTSLLDNLTQFMTTSRDSPFQRTGVGLQKLQDLLLIVFQKVSDDFKEKINKCYKVHLVVEETKKKNQADTWLSKATPTTHKCRILSYWCFSPNFGMQMLLEQGIRCVILTSGTLAPLKPLISELGINVDVRLENPHVVTEKQICVKILASGPDGVPLNSGFQNRDNKKYVSSLGMSIINIARQIPHGLLIFFPSYALLNKCKDSWQTSGLWSTLNDLKMVFVEPKTKDAFNSMMTNFYDRVKDPVYKGAIFMAVCRGKVSEGLDFADINGRAVIVTGIPYPPYKDNRVVLKRKYLDLCRLKNSEYLSGQDWYSLEATRAVNQAIGRVIRHRHDYGAILLLDNRFNNYSVKSQLSLWLRDQIKLAKNFGEVIRDMKKFFNEAALLYKPIDEKKENNIIAHSSTNTTVNAFNMSKPNAVSSSSKLQMNVTNDSSESDSSNKRTANLLQNRAKRKKIILVEPDYEQEPTNTDSNNETFEYIGMLKKNLEKELYEKFMNALSIYKQTSDIYGFIKHLNEIFVPNPHLRYLLQGMLPYIKSSHKNNFLEYWERIR